MKTAKTIFTAKRGDGLVKAVVKFEQEYQEYQVRLMRNGVEHKPARYHTDDRDDAIGTARLMCAS